jgi:phosphoesterase RecJ-like protein
MATRKSHSMKDVLRTIRSGEKFLVCTHVNPDPDALASQLAMARILEGLGKKAVMICPEPVAKRFDFLPGIGRIRLPGSVAGKNFDAAVIVDCGDYSRVGTLRSLLTAVRPRINIDHHITNNYFGEINLVLPRASSTAEIIYDFLEASRLPLTKELAFLLYVGIMTDTGSFRYDNTTARTHAVAARLLEYPLSVSRLYTKLYETIPLDDIRNLTRLVSRFELLEQGQVICLELTRRTIRRFSEDFDLRDKIFRHFRAIRDVEVIVILTEEKKGATRVNFRSQSRVDVARLASRFDGGGHSRASGCLIHDSMPNARKRVLAEVRKVLNTKRRGRAA